MVLIFRRFACGGELGGEKNSRIASCVLCVSLCGVEDQNIAGQYQD